MTEAHKGKSEAIVAQASLSIIMDDNKAKKLTRIVKARHVDDSAQKAWFQADKTTVHGYGHAPRPTTYSATIPGRGTNIFRG